jgi:hypothetical protein
MKRQETEGLPVCTERKITMKNQANHKNQQPELDASQLAIVELSDEQLDGVTGGVTYGTPVSMGIAYEAGANPGIFKKIGKQGESILKQDGQSIKHGWNDLKHKL